MFLILHENENNFFTIKHPWRLETPRLIQWNLSECWKQVYYDAVEHDSDFWVCAVDEILKCDHSSESYWAVLSCDTVYYALQVGSNFWVCRWNHPS